MTLPASGPISFNNINVELGVSGTTQASLGQTSYRNLAGVASGQISMSNFYGKASQFSLTISTDQSDVNLRAFAIAAGWNESSKVVVTINSGIYVSATSTGTPAMTISGSFPGGLELVNAGYIVGRGGAGAASSSDGASASSGGTALAVSTAVTILNASVIAGGGGGGVSKGTARRSTDSGSYAARGGGGGGGQSGRTNSTGGSGNSGAASGAPGTVSGPGAGGVGASNTYNDGKNNITFYGPTGNPGGSWGSSSGNYVGYDSKGNPVTYYGGAGGAAVTGNSNITWSATGTRYGAIS